MLSELNRSVPPEVTDFGILSLPPIRKLRLDNGLEVNIVDQEESKGMSSLTCVFRGGIAECGSISVAKMLPNLMLEGTFGHPDGGMSELIEFNGARVAFSVEPHYTSMTLFSLNSKIKDVLPLFPEVLFEPQLSERAFEVIRDRYLQNIELMRKKVEYQASMLFNTLSMGKSHPLARTEIPEDIIKIKVSGLLEWHKALCRCTMGGMTLYLSGRISSDIENAVNESFGRLKVEDDGMAICSRIVPFEASTGTYQRMVVDGAVQSAVRIGMPVIGREHPDYITMRYLIIALGGYFGSRLMANVREDKGYTYGINSFLLGQPEGGLMEVVASTDKMHEEPLIEEVVAEIKRLGSGDFTSGEIDRLRKNVMSGLASTLDNAFEIMDYYQTLQTAFIPDGYFERQIDVLNRLTAGELQRMANEYLSLDKLIVTVAGQ